MSGDGLFTGQVNFTESICSLSPVEREMFFFVYDFGYFSRYSVDEIRNAKVFWATLDNSRAAKDLMVQFLTTNDGGGEVQLIELISSQGSYWGTVYGDKGSRASLVDTGDNHLEIHVVDPSNTRLEISRFLAPESRYSTNQPPLSSRPALNC